MGFKFFFHFLDVKLVRKKIGDPRERIKRYSHFVFIESERCFVVIEKLVNGLMNAGGSLVSDTVN